jgi:hypothetical protein
MVDSAYRIDIPDGDPYRLDVYDPRSSYGPSGKRVVGATMFKFANDLGKEILEAKEENAAAIAQSEKMLEVVKKLQAATPETWYLIEAEVVEVMTQAGLANRLPPQRAIVDWEQTFTNPETGATITNTLNDIEVAWPPQQRPELYHLPPSSEIGTNVAFQLPDSPYEDYREVKVYVDNPYLKDPLANLSWMTWPAVVYGPVTKVEQTYFVQPDAAQLADMVSSLQNAANLKAQTDTNYAATLNSMLTLYNMLIQAAVAAYQSLAEDHRDQLRKTS